MTFCLTLPHRLHRFAACPRRGLYLALVCGWLVTGLVAAAPVSPPFDVAPARAALQRLLPRWQAQFDLIALPRTGAADHFEITGRAGHVLVKGTSPAVLLAGVETYLHRVAHVDIGWPGDSLGRLPVVLPAPSAPLDRRAVVPDRYALNDTDDGYANAYLGWPAWQHKIDLLALHGINGVFVPMGTAQVYRLVFGDFGYSDVQIRAWIPAAAYQPWWLLQNMAAFGGPMPPPEYARRTALAQKVVARLRRLGMTPVLPGYAGMLPPDFAARHPAAHIVPQGQWQGFARPDWLDPRDPLYAKIAADFYRRQRALFGDSTMFKMDLLHEGGRAGDVPLGAAARRVMAALQAAHTGARWVMLGWQHNPPAAVVDVLDRRQVLIVDGLSDRYDGMDREHDWHGAPYAFGSIANFGGHTSLGANGGVWLARFAKWRNKPGSALRGIAWMPEASGLDPAAFALFTRLAWEPGPNDEVAWFADYADWRYGGADPHAAAAWRILGTTAYAMPSGTLSEPQDSLFDARPSLDAHTAATWSPPAMRYDATRFQQAACQLLRVTPALRASSAYRYDLVDVTRQVLSNQARALLPQIKAAYETKDLAHFRGLTAQWMGDMGLLNRLLASDPHFLLGYWLAPARVAATDKTQAAQLEYDQRSIITSWGDRAEADAGGLHDYANRQLAGLVGGLYAARWRRYFDSLQRSLEQGRPPRPIDWFAMEQAWAHAGGTRGSEVHGNAYALATDAAQSLGICKAVVGAP